MSAQDDEGVLVKSSDTIQQEVTYLKCGVEPDLTIVVGGKVFKEYSITVRCWSDYFDAALKSGMKESHNMTFEFPDDDPAEWGWIVALTAPLPSLTVTKENVHTALAWFDRLRSPRGLNICDGVVCSDMVLVLLPEAETSQKMMGLTPAEVAVMRSSLGKLIQALETSIQYRLGESKKACFAIIKRVSNGIPSLFEVEHLTKLVFCLKDDDESRNALWSTLIDHLPPHMAERQGDFEALVKSELLPALMHSEIMRKEALEQKKGALEEALVQRNRDANRWKEVNAKWKQRLQRMNRKRTLQA